MESNTFLSYASSSSIKIIAKIAKIERKNIYLIEPCFDNIFHILNTENLEIIPVDEKYLLNPKKNMKKINNQSWLWLVLPNNPTGFWLSKNDFERLALHLKSCEATLIIDLCFKRFVSPSENFDVYEILNRIGVEYITIEDTGKTWSLGDLKVGITVCSSIYSDVLRRLHDELLLSVSPFTLELLSQFIEHWLSEEGKKSFDRRINNNRAKIEELANNKEISFIGEDAIHVPMVLMRIKNRNDLLDNWGELKRRGVELLPTCNYFWSGALDHLNAFRVPFLKPYREISIAAEEINNLISSQRDYDE